MKWRTIALVLASVLVATRTVEGDPPERSGGMPHLAPPASSGPAQGPTVERPDPIGECLFPPDLLMAHQRDLGITERQRQALVSELQSFQSRVVPLQWQLSEATEDLVALLQSPRVDEARALVAADRVMGLEREVKRAHLALLIRLKNVLTEEQQRAAANLRHPRADATQESGRAGVSGGLRLR